MKVKCSHCSAMYAVDDAKVSGKKFAFDCPKCGFNVIIDNRPKKEALSPSTAGIARSITAESNEKPKSPIPLSITDEISFDEQDFSSQSVEESLSSFPDDFESEIEPEIDLSVLNKKTDINSVDESDDDFLSPDLSSGITEEDLSGSGHTAPVEDISDGDESLTIDLESLDIDLAEPEEITAGVSPDSVLTGRSETDESERLSLPIEEIESAVQSSSQRSSDDEDESLTLDLNTLDIPLEESSDFNEGQRPDDADLTRLSLGDAGLSIDDVESEKDSLDEIESFEPLEEEPVKASAPGANDIDIDHIDFADELSKDSSISDELESFISQERSLDEDYTAEKLPEIDLDRYGEAIETQSDFVSIPAAPVEDRFLDIEAQKRTGRDDESLRSYDIDSIASSGGGYINYSIDYSFHYSRIKAILRLFGIYFITFIPYLLMAFLYSLISGAVGFINKILILFSGEQERDFSLMQEKTIRYLSSLFAALLNVVEEKPSSSGKKNIDYQLQMHVVYPPQYSRILAFLRLSIIGIFLISLPHVLLLFVLTIGMSLISFVSLIYTIFAGRWPSLMFDFMVRYLRYWTTVTAYFGGLIDTYPSFRFD
jgi:predicted Zn finger-like uncharacterized protein